MAAVGSIPDGGAAEREWNTYVWVDSADDTAAKVRDAGGGVVTEPFDVMDAGRMAVFADPEGAVFCVWQAERAQGRAGRQRARLAELQRARDPRRGGRARRSTARCSAGGRWTLDGGVLAWTLPGYGDHLERDNPGLRERVAEFGGPTGFEDVVAAINPIADDQPESPPHWNVTFAVDDADATAAAAARARRHGRRRRRSTRRGRG